MKCLWAGSLAHRNDSSISILIRITIIIIVIILLHSKYYRKALLISRRSRFNKSWLSGIWIKWNWRYDKLINVMSFMYECYQFLFLISLSVKILPFPLATQEHVFISGRSNSCHVYCLSYLLPRQPALSSAMDTTCLPALVIIILFPVVAIHPMSNGRCGSNQMSII